MLDFEEKNIKEKQAYALHKNMTFGVWEKDFEDRQSLVEKTFEKVFENWHCDIQCVLFYNVRVIQLLTSSAPFANS